MKKFYFYIYASGYGISNVPFIIENPHDNVTKMVMIQDINFSLKAKIGDIVNLKIYAVPKQDGPISKTTDYLMSNRSKKIKSFLQMGINVSEEENSRMYSFDNPNFKLVFWQHKMDNDEMYLSNPELIINTEYLMSLIK